MPALPAVLLAALCVTPAGAVTVHTWVDEDGVTHFADAPPGGGQPSREVQVDAGAARAPADDDPYSILNQWQRVRSEREAQDALALERERLEVERPAPPQVQAGEDDAAFLYPYYGDRRGRRHGWWPALDDQTGPPSPPGAFVNIKPPAWPRER